MEYKIGDKVRFVTTEPHWEAEHTTGELEAVYIFEDGALEVRYNDEPQWFMQTVHPDDVERV